MPGYVVYSPFDGKPVPAANEQVRDELVNVFGHHLERPELDDQAAEQEQAQEQLAAESGDQAEDQASEETGQEAGLGDDHESVRSDVQRLPGDEDH
jgi:hypothetical protein